MTAEPALRVEGLRHRYGDELVLDLSAWQVARDSSCVVLGASGSGKSTLLHILAGLTQASEGRIVVAGEDIGRLAAGERDRFRARRIGFVPQRLHLIGAISVADNLRLARRFAGLPPAEPRIAALLERLGIAALAARRPDSLSQGQAQRAAIARALVNEPALLLADEPTAALDEANAEAVIGLLLGAAQEHYATLLVATHDRRGADRFTQTLELPSTAGPEARP